MQSSVDWIRKYRISHPQNIKFSEACAGASINVRTANDIIASGRSCTLSTYCRLLKAFRFQLAIEDMDGELLILDDPVGIPRIVKDEMRWRMAKENHVSDFRLLTWKEMNLQLNIDRLTCQKIFFMEYEYAHANRNIDTTSLFSVLLHLNTHLWIIKDDKSKERMFMLL